MLKRIWSIIMSAVIFVCSLFGISIGGKSGEAEMITFDEAKKTVIVSLDENPSTGYGWAYEASPEDVLLLTSDTYHSDAPAGVAGAGGVRAFSFAGLREGSAILSFTYLRSWEGTPIRTVVIEVRVSADNRLDAALISDNA